MRPLKATMSACVLAAAVLVLAGTAPTRASAAPSGGHFTGTLADGTTWIADVPANWNGILLLYSHGFGPLTAADAPDPGTQAALLARGDGRLLRQAFVASYGHCNFSSAELVAGVMAISHRVTTGQWGSVADPASLNQVASGLGLGQAGFTDYFPGPLTGATGPVFRLAG